MVRRCHSLTQSASHSHRNGGACCPLSSTVHRRLMAAILPARPRWLLLPAKESGAHLQNANSLEFDWLSESCFAGQRCSLADSATQSAGPRLQVLGFQQPLAADLGHQSLDAASRLGLLHSPAATASGAPGGFGQRPVRPWPQPQPTPAVAGWNSLMQPPPTQQGTEPAVEGPALTCGDMRGLVRRARQAGCHCLSPPPAQALVGMAPCGGATHLNSRRTRVSL
jgi:hypothetical protein